MKHPQTIHLGFEVGTGKPVEIPVKHMAVTGQSQEAGKTTALEALITRSGLRAVVFKTKRGEGSFAAGRKLKPYFRERADWVFVASVIDATLGEKNKLLRSFLMKVCRNTKTLAQVRANVKEVLKTAKGFNESIYTEIDGYLDLVVPQLKQLPPAASIVLGAGLNVMDLSDYSSQLQGLVIRSVMEHVYEHEEGVITVVPEAWEFLPESRGSPVKLAAESLIRKGASLRNYMWLDSQDMGGVWKLPLRQAGVWLIGVQREANELKRALSNIPAGIHKPSAADVARLQLGQFYACWGSHSIRTYVQPAWMDDTRAKLVAKGEVLFDAPSLARAVNAGDLRAQAFESSATKGEAAPDPTPTEEDEMSKEDVESIRGAINELTMAIHTALGTRTGEPASTVPNGQSSAPLPDFEQLYQAFKRRFIQEAGDDPAFLKVLARRPRMEVEVDEPTITADAKGGDGFIGLLISEKFFDGVGATGNAVFMQMQQRGISGANPTAYGWCDSMVSKGFLTKVQDGKVKVYRAVPGMKVNIVRKKS